jgi:DNA modification methylase
MPTNRLYYGDNLSIMQRMPRHCVDLIYLDPPFKSQQNYNLIYKTMTGKPVPEQAEAFCDTWDMDAEKEHLARSMPDLMRQHGVEDYYVQFWQLWIKALRQTQPHLLAYMIYMVERMLHMKSILRPTGSIYLHCDPTASHYIKVMMDGNFGQSNFRNEIIWKRTNSRSTTGRWPRVHDVILFYTNGSKFRFHPQRMKGDITKIPRTLITGADGKKYQTYELTAPGRTKAGESGRQWRGFDPDAMGRHWANTTATMDAWDAQGLIHWPKNGGFPRRRDAKPFEAERREVTVPDVWTDIDRINQAAKERMGYPTQKPIALLRRIIEASTDAGDVVFDPFCGCGTTIYAAQEIGRKWVGCDVAILAVRLVEQQLNERYGLVKGEHYEVDGIPNSVDAARTLWEHDRFQFEHWAVERVGGFPTKKTGDKGVDGRIYFETQQSLNSMVLSVKGGAGIHPTDIRDLVGVLSSETDAPLAGFISLKEPSKGMREAAARAGVWEYRGVSYPRIQLLTVREIVEERRDFQMPTRVGVKTTTPQTMLPL